MNIFRSTAAVASLLLSALVAADDSSFTDQQICRAAIATIMHKDVSTVSASGEGTIFVSYSNAGLKKYKCRIEGARVMWGNVDGRWRNGAYDEKVMWEASGDTLTIRQPFSDGSVSVDEFSRGELLHK